MNYKTSPEKEKLFFLSVKDAAFETEFCESVLRRHGGDVRALCILGHLYTRQGRIEDGLRADRALVRLRPHDALARYNLACSCALLRDRRGALAHLRKAVALGFDDAEQIRKDPDLAALRGSKPFEDILEGLRAKSAPQNGYFLS